MRLGIWFAEKPSDWIDTLRLGLCVSCVCVCVCVCVFASCSLFESLCFYHAFGQSCTYLLYSFSPLIPQDTHPHIHTIHTYMHILHIDTHTHKETHTLTLCQRWLWLLVNKLLYLYLLSHRHKWFDSSSEVCFLQREKGSVDVSSLMFVNHCSLKLLTRWKWLLAFQEFRVGSQKTSKNDFIIDECVDLWNL